MDTLIVNTYFSEKPKRQKILRTISLLFAWICMGLFAIIPGPTLIDLKLRIGANYEEISDAISGQDVGYFIGSAIGALLADRFMAYCDLMVGIALSGAAIATVCAPFAPVVRALWFCILVHGLSIGIMDVAGQRLALMMWQEKSPSPLNVIHGGFGVGAFIVPLIANPFLAVVKNIEPFNMSEKTYVNISVEDNATEYAYKLLGNNTDKAVENGNESLGSYQIEFLKESRIEIPYLITAIIIMVVSLLFYIFQFNDVREMKRSKTITTSESSPNSKRAQFKLKDIINPATCADGHFLYGGAIFFTLFLFYFNLVGTERILGVFIRAYSIEQLDFSVDAGSYLNTSFWISFAVGRFLGFLAARWIPIRILLLIDTVGVLISSILLNLFSVSNPLAFWILLQPLGLFLGPVYPVGVGWGNYHVNMTGMALCMLLVGSALGGMAYIRLTGFMFETFGPRTFLYHLLGAGIAAVALAVVLHVIGARHGNRFNKESVNKHETVLQSLNEISERNIKEDRDGSLK